MAFVAPRVYIPVFSLYSLVVPYKSGLLELRYVSAYCIWTHIYQANLR